MTRLHAFAAVSVAVALMWALAADAKDLYHPRGEVVDARGLLVGGLVGAPEDPMVLLRVKETTFVLRILDAGVGGFSEGPASARSVLYFETPNCTGRGYTNLAAGLFDQIIVRDRLVLYRPEPDLQGERIIAASWTVEGQPCGRYRPPAQTDIVYPVELLIDLTGRWKPPFRVR